MTDTQKYAVPLEREHYPGAVAGFRAFRFERGELTALTNCGNHHLSLGGYPVWSLGVNEASCPKGIHDEGDVPSADCSCGFWLHRDIDALLSEEIIYVHEDVPVVLALVAGWGRIADHEEGLRVQYARPVAFFEAKRNKKSVYDYAALSNPWGIPSERIRETPTHFTVPEELREPRVCAHSGHEGRVEREDIDRVVAEYGLSKLTRSKPVILEQYRRPPGTANGEDEMIFCPTKSPPDEDFLPVGRWVNAGTYRYFYAGEGTRANAEDMTIAHFGDPEYAHRIRIACPTAFLAHLEGDSQAVSETYLAFARDIMRVMERPLYARRFLCSEFGYSRTIAHGYTSDALREVLDYLRTQVRLVELAISGEHLTSTEERTVAQEEQIERLFSRREKYLRDAAGMDRRIREAEELELAGPRRTGIWVDSHSEMDEFLRRISANSPAPPSFNWHSHPHSHVWASPPRKVRSFPPNIAVPEEDEPGCCPPGTHPAKHVCRRVWLFVCRAARRASEAFGKLRPEVFRGARPSNASPLWYTFHRKEK